MHDVATRHSATEFSAILAAAQRRFSVDSLLTIYAFTWGAPRLLYSVFLRSPWGGLVFSKWLQDVYRIIRVSGRSSERDAERSRAVIAAGFFHAADARECAVRWLKRYCPEATYLPDSGRWRVQDEDGSIHLFCIEPTAGRRAHRGLS